MNKTIRVKVAPFGEYRTQAGTEVFDAEGVGEAVKASNGRLFGEPIYHGFPHFKGQEAPSKARLAGRVKRLLMTEWGLEADISLTKFGRSLAEQGGYCAADHGTFRSLGEGRFRFERLLALGLTKNPALPIPEVKL
jgi:hypothetical protein